MVYKVEVSESADHDIDEIFKYIVDKLENPKAAIDFADALEKKYSELESHPFMFELSRNERLAQRGHHLFVIGNYVALYQVDEERRKVIITRIFYGQQDYGKYF